MAALANDASQNAAAPIVIFTIRFLLALLCFFPPALLRAGRREDAWPTAPPAPSAPRDRPRCGTTSPPPCGRGNTAARPPSCRGLDVALARVGGRNAAACRTPPRQR